MAATDREHLVVKRYFDCIISSKDNSDFLFDQIREDWKKSNNMYILDPYTHTSDGSLDFLKEANVNKAVAAPAKRGVNIDSLNSTQGRSNSTQEYLKPNDILANYNKIITNHLNNGAAKILKEAHQHREKILEKFIANPHIPSSEVFLFRATRFADQIAFGCCGTGPLNVVIVWLVFLFVYPVYWLACLGDLITGRVNANRGSPEEKQWLESAMLAHPELESNAINQKILSELNTMASTLKKLYTKATYEVFTVDDPVQSDGQTVNKQKFVLRILPREDAGSRTTSSTQLVTAADVHLHLPKEGGEHKV